MRRSARTVLCGGRSVMIVPTASTYAIIAAFQEPPSCSLPSRSSRLDSASYMLTCFDKYLEGIPFNRFKNPRMLAPTEYQYRARKSNVKTRVVFAGIWSKKGDRMIPLSPFDVSLLDVQRNPAGVLIEVDNVLNVERRSFRLAARISNRTSNRQNRLRSR